MPLFTTIQVSEGLIGVWQLTETSDKLLAVFAPDEITDSDFQKFNYEKRKVEWLATRILLKQLIGPDFSVSYTETGKPLLNHILYKYLSISHSQEFVAVFVHQRSEVGLDIEKQSRNYNSIEKRYLSADEIIQAGKNPICQCLYWCAKEAIFKLVSDEGISFKEQIRITPFNIETDTQFKVSFISGENATEYMAGFITFSDQCLVWAAS